MAFSPQRLHAELLSFPPAPCYRVALSGGLDSTVLLHALAQLRGRLDARLAAVHVDHGLHPDSGEWSEACRRLCGQYGIPCEVVRVDAGTIGPDGPEATARRLRYAALAGAMGQGELLLMAHHRNDQAETLLLQLFRGAGPRGLAGMPRSREFGPGRLGRPLLDVPRDELRAYADECGLVWVDDPSNFDTAFNRNLLRREVMPQLRRRWPGLDAVLARSAGHFSETAALLDELAADDLTRAVGGAAGTLSITALLALRPERRRNLLRHWIRGRGLPVPDSVHLERILFEAVPARADAAPQVSWHGAEVRRYRDDLYVMPPLPPVPAGEWTWPLSGGLIMSPRLGALSASGVNGRGLKAGLAERGVTVRFRTGGEYCRPLGRRHTHSLKKLCQEAGIPPWERDRTPLLFVDGELAAVVGRWLCEPFAAAGDEAGVVVEWRSSAIAT